MKTIEFKIKVPVDNYWDCFLPIKESEWIKFNYKSDTKDYYVKIGVENILEGQGHIDKIDEKQINKTIIPGNLITIILNTQWSEDEYNSLLKQNKVVDDLHNELEVVFFKIISLLLDNLRNGLNQYWLSDEMLVSKNYMNLLEWKCKEENEWARFPKPTLISFRSVIRPGITKEQWLNLSQRIKMKKRSEFFNFLLSNAQNNLEMRNYRIAIIECVIAVEHILSNHAKNLISPNFKINENAVSKIFEKMGLRGSSELIFKEIAEFGLLDKKACNHILKGIELRNSIIHHKTKNIKAQDAKDIVNSVGKLIKVLNETQ